tara:strand:+ start:10635 stop:14291 length:3657 start_codon:yes stop_codon:yes gene_type:complete
MYTAALETDPQLAAWMKKREPAVKELATTKIKAKRRRQKAPEKEDVGFVGAVQVLATPMELEEAKAWVVDAAAELAAKPPPTPQQKDDTGLSGATNAPIRAFLRLVSDPDLPTDAFLGAAEYLRLHSRTQLDTEEYKRALQTLKQFSASSAKDAQRLLVGGTLFVGEKGAQVDEGNWKLRSDYSVGFQTERKQDFKLSNVALENAGFVKGEDFFWDRSGGGFTLVVFPHALPDFLEFLSRGWPDLATTVRPYVPSIIAKADVEPVERESLEEEEIPFAFEPDKFRVLLDVGKAGMRANDIARALNNIPKWENINGLYWSKISLDDLEEVRELVKGKAEAGPRAARPAYQRILNTIDAHIEEWLAVGLASLQQDEDYGIAGGGRWRKEGDRVLVETWFIPKNQLGGPFRSRYRKGHEYPLLFKVRTSKIPQLADEIRPHFPRLAEAMTRAFGGVASISVEEREYCEPLIDLSNKLAPVELSAPAAIEATEKVMDAFEKNGPGGGLVPYPYQVNGIAFAMLTGWRALIGDAMGLGKTIQGLGAIIVDPKENLPALIVAPPTVIYGAWVPEAEEWLKNIPGNPPIIVLSKGHMPPKGFKGVAITGWPFIRKHADELGEQGFKLMIMDEAHYGKAGMSTAQGRSMIKLADLIPHVLLLTGTPIKNAVSELWPLLSSLQPDVWGKNKEDFRRKYSEVVGEGRRVREVGVNEERKHELKERLACTMIRRLKSEAMPDLPPMQRQPLVAKLTDDQLKRYVYAADEFEKWFREQVQIAIERQAAEQGRGPDELTPDEIRAVNMAVARSMRAKAIVKLGKLRQITGEAKADRMRPVIKALKKNGESAIFWAHHKNVVNTLKRMLEEEGVSWAAITGGVSNQERGEIAKDFQDGGIQVLIATTAAKEGLTLTRANRAYFVERYWTPADEAQAEARIWRIGQTRPSTNYFLGVPRTIDERMDEIIEGKRQVIDEVLGDESIEKKFAEDLQDHIIMGLGYTGALTNPKKRRAWLQEIRRNPYTGPKKTSPHSYRKSRGRGKMDDVCPGCCVGPEGEIYGTACFHSNTRDGEPVWECGNCSYELPRRIRRSKGKIALDKLQGKKNPRKTIPIGQCYPFAVNMAEEWLDEHITPGGRGRKPKRHAGLNNKKKFKVVHGRITDKFSGESFLHAWVEKGNKVFDWQTHGGKPEGIPKAVYYDIFQPEPHAEYNAEEAEVQCRRSGSPGPWAQTL